MTVHAFEKQLGSFGPPLMGSVQLLSLKDCLIFVQKNSLLFVLLALLTAALLCRVSRVLGGEHLNLGNATRIFCDHLSFGRSVRTVSHCVDSPDAAHACSGSWNVESLNLFPVLWASHVFDEGAQIQHLIRAVPHSVCRIHQPCG